MMTKFLEKKNFGKVFSSEKKAGLNQERFTLDIDDTIGELRNGTKSINISKSHFG